MTAPHRAIFRSREDFHTSLNVLVSGRLPVFCNKYFYRTTYTYFMQKLSLSLFKSNSHALYIHLGKPLGPKLESRVGADTRMFKLTLSVAMPPWC